MVATTDRRRQSVRFGQAMVILLEKARGLRDETVETCFKAEAVQAALSP